MDPIVGVVEKKQGERCPAADEIHINDATNKAIAAAKTSFQHP